jgi:hypothetical protein
MKTGPNIAMGSSYPHVPSVMTHNSCQTWSRLHAALAVVTGLILPAASWIDGSGWLAWTMYSRSGSYRLTVEGQQRSSGDPIPIAPTAMSLRASGTIRIALAGADHWRFSPFGSTLRVYLASVGQLACDVEDVTKVDLVLEEQATLDASIRRTRVSVLCPGPR